MTAFLPNPKFAEAAAADPEFQEGLAEVAGDVANQAEALARSVGAPWMPRPGHDVVEIETADDGSVYVVITDYAGHLIEYGSSNNPVHAPLRRAAMAAGLDVTEQP